MQIVLLLLSLWLSAEAFTTPQFSEKSSLRLLSSAEDDESPVETPIEPTFFQRVFYRLNPSSDVDDYKAMVVEERLRYKKKDNTMIPMGPRTVLLREGDVEDGVIGDAFCTLQVEPNGGTSLLDLCTVAQALYLASNPQLVDESVLAINGGLGALLGSVGAGFVKNQGTSTKQREDDILPTKKEGIFPKGLERLTLTEPTEDSPLFQRIPGWIQQLDASQICQEQILDWSHKHVLPRGTSKPTPEYFTVLSSNLRGASYPELSNFARCMAHRLAGTRSYPTKSLPKWIHIDREGNRDLHKLVTDGYLLTATSTFLEIEKLTFKVQELAVESTADEIALDFDVDLELESLDDISLQCMVGTHSPEYAGGGSGELFFPMETGVYGGDYGGEREASDGRWG